MPSKKEKMHDTDYLVHVLKERLKLLIVCISSAWGGLEQVAAQDAHDLSMLGLDVHVLVKAGSPIHENLISKATVKIHVIDFQPRNYFDLKMRRVLRELTTDHQINLIHSHQTSLIGSIVPWFWRKPQMVIMASRHIMSGHDKRDFFHALIYRRVDALIVMSETLRQNVLETHVLKERQLKVVRLGLDFTYFDPEQVNTQKQRAIWGADKNTLVIGMVGRIDPAKGQATFIRAAAGLMKLGAASEHLRFIIVGEETLGQTSQYFEELQEMVAQFHLQDKIVFAGYQKDIPAVMDAFDIFVMPSRQEAFGLVAIEAMAMRCPIVITNGGSAPEIVGAEEYGLLVRPDDAFDLQRKLRKLIDHPEVREQMGRKARDHVQKNYDRNDRVQQTLSLYERGLRARHL